MDISYESRSENLLVSNIDTGSYDYTGGQVTEQQCDVVIIGAGGSGCCAAVRAAENGAKVIVVEKAANPGGNTWMAVGCALALNLPGYQPKNTLGPGEMTMGRAESFDYQDIKDAAFNRCMEIEKWRRDPQVIHACIDNSDSVYRWFLEKGMHFDSVTPRGLGLARRQKHHDAHGHNDPSNGPGFVGSYVVETMVSKFDELGIQLFTRTRATDLLQDETGNVVGIVAQRAGETIQIHAGAVIISSGGFSANKELMQKYFSSHFPAVGSNYCRMGSGYMTGDGILMAERIGAASFNNMTLGIGGTSHHPWSYPVLQSIAANNIYVNLNGERFVPEDFMQTQNSMALQPGNVCYAICDAKIQKKNIEAAKARKAGEDSDEHDAMERIEAELQQEAAEGSGKVLYANTLEELAAKMGIPIRAFLDTVETYNRDCDAGEDSYLYKSPRFLEKIEQAPFCAVKLQRFQIVTSGGLDTNVQMQVLDCAHKPIPGLYVTGDCSDGSGALSGLGWAFTSGYLAGAYAAAYAAAQSV
jgi:fumarate reductase flavoprotein subunit